MVEGHSRISTAIKYLTQSTWSHASLFVGFRWRDVAGKHDHCFVEADVVQGVRSVGIDQYARLHRRICRPAGLNSDECLNVCNYVTNRVGHHYDLRNVFDLARYLLPTPPVPVRFRRNMLCIGSGDPTRAICSTLIAQAFQSVRYPIITTRLSDEPDKHDTGNAWSGLFRFRHYSFFVPRDFDVSPFFQLVKPPIESGFDFRQMRWLADDAPGCVHPELPRASQLDVNL